MIVPLKSDFASSRLATHFPLYMPDIRDPQLNMRMYGALTTPGQAALPHLHDSSNRCGANGL
jgi:hypothetical protein